MNMRRCPQLNSGCQGSWVSQPIGRHRSGSGHCDLTVDLGLLAPVEDQRHVPVVAGQGPVLQTDEVAGVWPLTRVERDVANLAPGPGQSCHNDG